MKNKTDTDMSVTVNRETIVQAGEDALEAEHTEWQHIPKRGMCTSRRENEERKESRESTHTDEGGENGNWMDLETCGGNQSVCLKQKWVPDAKSRFVFAGKGACVDENNKYPTWGEKTLSSGVEAQHLCATDPFCRAISGKDRSWRFYCTKRSETCNRSGSTDVNTKNLFGSETFDFRRARDGEQDPRRRMEKALNGNEVTCMKKIVEIPRTKKSESSKSLLIKRMDDQFGGAWGDDLQFYCGDHLVQAGIFRRGLHVGNTGWFQFDKEATDKTCLKYLVNTNSGWTGVTNAKNASSKMPDRYPTTRSIRQQSEACQDRKRSR